MASSSLGSSKRPCAKVNNAFQQVTCLVDECAIDLSDCRKYYQRHKVCENHSKSSQVSIDGQKLRFCQQCSRFHSLDEFDEGKRSCRKRLDGHNRRRRKARPYLFPTNHGLVSGQSVGQQGQVNPTMGVTNLIWSGVVEPPALVDHQIGAFSLLSSAVAPLGRVVHYPSESGSVSMSTSPLDQGLGYDGLGNDCDMGSDGMTDRGNYNHAYFYHGDPFYWKS